MQVAEDLITDLFPPDEYEVSWGDRRLIEGVDNRWAKPLVVSHLEYNRTALCEKLTQLLAQGNLEFTGEAPGVHKRHTGGWVLMAEILLPA